MAHYAFLDENNIVTEVIVGIDENQGVDYEVHYGNFRSQTCKRTSYNTHYGTHKKGKEPFRKNYAGRGYFFDEARDAFIPPKPYDSWVLNEEKCIWDAPTPRPTDGGRYSWNEEKKQWDTVE